MNTYEQSILWRQSRKPCRLHLAAGGRRWPKLGNEILFWEAAFVLHFGRASLKSSRWLCKSPERPPWDSWSKSLKSSQIRTPLIDKSKCIRRQFEHWTSALLFVHVANLCSAGLRYLEKEWMWDFNSILTGLSSLSSKWRRRFVHPTSQEVSDLPRSTSRVFEKRLKNISYSSLPADLQRCKHNRFLKNDERSQSCQSRILAGRKGDPNEICYLASVWLSPGNWCSLVLHEQQADDGA